MFQTQTIIFKLRFFKHIKVLYTTVLWSLFEISVITMFEIRIAVSGVLVEILINKQNYNIKNRSRYLMFINIRTK